MWLASSPAWRVRKPSTWLVVVAACAGCNALFDIEKPTHRVESQLECTLKSDCPAGQNLVCLFSRCSEPCHADIDCAAGLRCLYTTDGTACVSASQAACGVDGGTDCPDGASCVDNACYATCSAAAPCMDGHECVDGSCTGAATSADGGSGGSGTGGAPGAGSGGTSTAATCGNGQLDAGETCDDGNTASGDGCDGCAVEAGYTCSNIDLPSTCADVNECMKGMNNCDANATCTNTPGSFACACKPGFVGNGVTCEDVNECTKGTNNCSANAICTNTPGSFSCACKPGYAGGGVTCSNVNECTNGTSNCSPNATCTDTPGSFTCACNTNYTGTGVTCVPSSSCVGLPAKCGATADDDCCASPTVTGGTFTLGGSSGTTAATVATFALDKYEVTVGRFRNFVSAYAGPPASGAGANAAIAGSGWQTAWNNLIAPDSTQLTTALQCTQPYPTWNTSGKNDLRPMNCVDWFEAFAFCAWDGGRLPSEAEWEYAASGGSNELTYPWGSTPVPDDMEDSTEVYANYYCMGDASAPFVCAFSDILPVGYKPSGVGKFGQMDLAGSVSEWTLDWFNPYPATCNNCASSISGSFRVFRGGAWGSDAIFLPAQRRAEDLPGSRTDSLGFRCARKP